MGFAEVLLAVVVALGVACLAWAAWTAWSQRERKPSKAARAKAEAAPRSGRLRQRETTEVRAFATGMTPTYRFWSAVVLFVLGGGLFAEGLGDDLFDQSEPSLLFAGLLCHVAALFNLIVAAVQRGIIDAR